MKKSQSPSIIKQFTTLLIGTVVVSLFVIGGILIYVSFLAQSNQLKITQQISAQVVAEKVNAYFDDLLRKLTYLARVRGFTTFDVTAQRDLLNGLLYHNNAYEMVGITDHTGHLQMAVSRGNETAPREWGDTLPFRRAFGGQEDFIGPVEFLSHSPFPVLTFAVPVRDDQNNVDGMLFAHINLKFIWAILDEIKAGEDGYIYILSPRQILIAQSGSNPEQATHEDISKSPLGAVLSGLSQEPGIYRGLRGKKVFGTKIRITSNSWYAVVEIPVTEAYTPLIIQLFVMIGGLIISIIILARISLAMAQKATRPLAYLTDAATRLSRGELETRVLIEQENEFKVLADAFNHMAATLDNTINQLQQDIKKRKQAEFALRESETRFSTIFHSSPLGTNIFRFSDSHPLDVNNAFLEITGYSRDEFMAHTAEELHLFVNPDDFTGWIKKLSEEGQTLSQDTKIYQKTGEIRDVLASLEIIYIEGIPTGLMVIADITERKKAEEKIKSLNVNLEERVNERTESLNKVVNSMVGRELRMVELKQVITKLEMQLKDAGMKPATDLLSAPNDER